MRLVPWFASILALLCPGGAALANDSVAATGAGGIVLQRSEDIDMVSEELIISMSQIRVFYVFRNRSSADIRTLVAFPLPDHDLRDDFYGGIAYPREFETLVDQREVPMQVELRAVLGGVDHTALLERLGVPISYRRGSIDTIVQALSALPQADRDHIVALGLAEEIEEPRPGRLLTPTWTVRETWHWEQVFPAGRDLAIHHRYRPGVGFTNVSWLGDRALDESDDGRAKIDRYCISPAFRARVRRLRRSVGADFTIAEAWIRYVLSTGANWRAPIGSFRLVVNHEMPRSLVSFCGEGIRRIGPNQVEMRRTNWRPDRDLDILILFPRRPIRVPSQE